MEKHYSFTDHEFVTRFSECNFPPSYFTHEAHLRLAWIHIKTYGVQKAVKHVNREIKAFTEHLNASDKYHQTITSAAVFAVSHFYTRSESSSFSDFINEFPQLKTDFLELLSTHYSFDLVNSEEARKEFLEPDLAPF